jgi:hypothetical protein
VKEEGMHKHPEHVSFLYLPDGRIILVCVVKANYAQLPMAGMTPAKLEAKILCGGSPI